MHRSAHHIKTERRRRILKMMSEDREILRSVWEGRLAVCISLAPEDTIALSKPDPHYLLLPRVSYMLLVLEKVKKSLQRFIAPELQENEFWLDFEGIPLKPHYPIGVLHDVLNQTWESPWQLTLHFSRLPDALVSFPARDRLEAQFLSYIKEADAMKKRGSVMAAMQSKDQKQLWQGVANDKFDQFWSVNQKLMESSPSNGFKNIPVRIHLPPPDDSGDGSTLPAYPKPPVMRPQRPASDTGQLLLMSDLRETFKDVLREGECLMVQGVIPPLDTPLLWLSQHLSYPDNFLHFCVRRPSAATPSSNNKILTS